MYLYRLRNQLDQKSLKNAHFPPSFQRSFYLILYLRVCIMYMYHRQIKAHISYI
jgi:hypothetical protein